MKLEQKFEVQDFRRRRMSV